MKRIGYLGDIHAEDELLEIALQKLSQENVDIIVSVGDIVDGPGDIERTVALLRHFGVSTVRGNHDRWFLSDQVRELPEAHEKHQVSAEAVEWLEALPTMIELSTVAGNVLVCHGLGENDMASIKPWDDLASIRDNIGFRNLCRLSSAKFILNGHSHMRMVRSVEDRIIINAGALCRDHDPSFGLVDFETSTVYAWSFKPDCSYGEIEPILFDESPPETRRER